METLTLHPGKKKWVKMLLISSAFVLGAGFMIAQHHQDSMACGGALFFGLGVLVSIAKLIPNFNALFLTPEGFSLKSFGRTHANWKIKWRDLEDFAAVEIPLPVAPVQELVGLRFTPAARAEMSPTRRAKMDRHRQSYGCDGALPDSYGMSVGELVALLNEWRTRHVAT